MIKKDWFILSWSAKWLGEKAIMYADQRRAKLIADDKKLLKGIWKLLNKADIIITQNGIKFDIKKLNARFLLNGFKPPNSFRHIDTYKIAKKHFALTSSRLEYMTDKICKKNKKTKSKKFPGFELWKQCLKGNVAAFKEMEKYNRMDVLSLEELYHALIPWDSSLDFSSYYNKLTCSCGSQHFQSRGYRYSNGGKKRRMQCNDCGKELCIPIKKGEK